MLTKRLRSGSWYIRGTVYCGQKTAIVKEFATGIRDEEIAEQFLRQEELRIQKELLFGVEQRKTRVTFAEAALLYINRPGGIAPGDLLRIRDLNTVLGDTIVAEIMEGWVNFKAERCKGLSPRTVNRFRDTMMAAINYACEQWQIAAPKVKSEKVDAKRMRWLSHDEQSRLLATYPKHVQPIALTLCFQGCRTQEALQLDWKFVNLIRGEMHFDDTKSGVPRSIAMHESVKLAVTELWEKQGRPMTGHVFLNRLGRPYSDTRDYKYPGGNPLRKAHVTACIKAEIKDFRIHDWRHHWASWCVMAGIDLETIRRMGGWSTLRMLEKYAAVSTEHMHESMQKLSSIWASGGQG